MPGPARPPRAAGSAPHPRNQPFTGVLASSCKSKKKKKKWCEENNTGISGLEGSWRGRQRGAGSRRLRPRRRPGSPAPGAGRPGERRQRVLAFRASGPPLEPSKFSLSLAVGAARGEGMVGTGSGRAPPHTAAAGRGTLRDGTGQAAGARRAPPGPCPPCPWEGATLRPGCSVRALRRRCPALGTSLPPRDVRPLMLHRDSPVAGREGSEHAAVTWSRFQSRPKLNAGGGREGGGREGRRGVIVIKQGN